jgi:hypothetical protein
MGLRFSWVIHCNFEKKCHLGYFPVDLMGNNPYQWGMIKEIIHRIETESAARGIAPSTFCLRAVNDGKFFKRLQEGGTINLRTLDKLNAYFEGEEK